jgi:hypothetical protein
MVLSLPIAPPKAVNIQPTSEPTTLEVAAVTHCPGVAPAAAAAAAGAEPTAATEAAAIAIACRFPSEVLNSLGCSSASEKTAYAIQQAHACPQGRVTTRNSDGSHPASVQLPALPANAPHSRKAATSARLLHGDVAFLPPAASSSWDTSSPPRVYSAPR